jgi:Pheromone A receptor
MYIPPLVLSTVSIVFACMSHSSLLAHHTYVFCLALALRHFMLRRISFAAHLQTSNSALTTSRYLRLMLMSAMQMVWSVTVTSYTLWFTTISIPMRPWTNWADVHSDWLRIDTYATVFTPQIVITTYYILWWTIPASTIIFVGFFAFGRDAVGEYKRCFVWFRTRVLRLDAGNKSTKGSFAKVLTIGYDCFISIQIPARLLTSTLIALPPKKLACQRSQPRQPHPLFPPTTPLLLPPSPKSEAVLTTSTMMPSLISRIVIRRTLLRISSKAKLSPLSLTSLRHLPLLLRPPPLRHGHGMKFSLSFR